MTKATIFHAQNTRDSMLYDREGKVYNRLDALKALANGGYTAVAQIEVPNDSEEVLEDIYCKTQNINKPWRESAPCRSTSVGDIVVIGEAVHIVADFGFEKL